MSRFRNTKITDDEQEILFQHMLDFQAKKSFGVKFDDIELEEQFTVLEKVQKFIKVLKKVEDRE
tara:strand:- start:20 stop:211 length:192 start_codon:yes stop_codon:yes gene_type:complete